MVFLAGFAIKRSYHDPRLYFLDAIYLMGSIEYLFIVSTPHFTLTFCVSSLGKIVLGKKIICST